DGGGASDCRRLPGHLHGGDAGCDRLPLDRQVSSSPPHCRCHWRGHELHWRLYQLFPGRGDGRHHRCAADTGLSHRILLRAQARHVRCTPPGNRDDGGSAVNLVDTLLAPFAFDFMVTALMIAVVVAIPMALLSCFVVLKGWSLMG